ncbi:MAG TPA: thrombospondin type 3 repeat-containing protein [Candidatus Binatia bacterium]|nr:thrombospondin type 3 repeat-containing protein [Candidatus Binatia bacterium]
MSIRLVLAACTIAAPVLWLAGVPVGHADPATAVCGDPDDVDCDHVPDELDNCPTIANASQSDSDGDGAGDACDNCPSTGNRDQEDVNADGQGDLCDLDDGLVYLTLRAPTYLWWQPEIGMATFNMYRGQLEVLTSRGLYAQDPILAPQSAQFCDVVQSAEPFSDTVQPAAGEALFYLVTGNRGGVESSLGKDSAGFERPNTFPCRHPTCDRVFDSVTHTKTSGIYTQQSLLIDNPVAWCQFWGSPFPCDTQGIDFQAEVAIVATSGYATNGCHDVAVTCVRSEAADSIHVVVTNVVPGGLCGCPDNIGSPLDVVKVRRPVSSATFEWAWYSLNCPL